MMDTSQAGRTAMRDRLVGYMLDAKYLEETGGPMSIVHAIRRHIDRTHNPYAEQLEREDAPNSISTTSLDDEDWKPQGRVRVRTHHEAAWADIA